jgi:hypothetical protein
MAVLGRCPRQNSKASSGTRLTSALQTNNYQTSTAGVTDQTTPTGLRGAIEQSAGRFARCIMNVHSGPLCRIQDVDCRWDVAGSATICIHNIPKCPSLAASCRNLTNRKQEKKNLSIGKIENTYLYCGKCNLELTKAFVTTSGTFEWFRYQAVKNFKKVPRY